MSLHNVLKSVVNKAESDLLDGLKELKPENPAEGILYGSSWLIASIGAQYDQAFQGRIIERTVCAGAFALGGVVSAVKGVTARRRPLLQSAVEHREN
jgi:hypothetical protein